MGGQHTHGFTIIESLLFLSISGLMMVTMIAGTSLALNTQRYHDSVRSFKALLQEQYAKLSSTENERASTFQCGVDGTATPQQNALSSRGRGQSQCEVFGRYMLVQGADVSVYPLLVYRVPANKPTNASDIALMRDADYFVIGADSSSVQTTSLEWGARIAWPTSGAGSRSPTTPRSLSILFVRSPETGSVYTFTSDSVPSDTKNISQSFFQDMMIANPTIPGQGGRTVCIDSNGFLVTSNMSIFISAYASGPSSIEMQSNDYVTGLGRDTRC